ncbi:Transcription elongation factor B polypeptide 3 [Tupaia chinensis]|uniref:Elongin-A n=1 Tax=Tupaia chinensis TaxID=246437 RepID=L9L2Y9_TUPCH|nr:Transcription elongation factor B polypeptide 3 [Tupaia chinensis]
MTRGSPDQRQACPAIAIDKHREPEHPDRLSPLQRGPNHPISGGDRSTARMAAGSVLQAVEKLQVRLATRSEPKKLWKDLEKLSALPISADILAVTGVRKTVKSLRKHKHVGSFARDLAARWKRLTPVQTPGPGQQDMEKSHSGKRPRDALEEEMEGGAQGHWRAPRSRRDSPEHREKKSGNILELERSRKRPPSRERRDERKRRRAAPARSSDPESDDCQVQAPPLPGSLPWMSVSHHGPPEDGPKPTAPRQKSGKCQAGVLPDRLSLSQEGHLGGPPGKGVEDQSQVSTSSGKEKRPAGAHGHETSWTSKKPHKALSKKESQRPLSGDGRKKRSPSRGVKKAKEREHRSALSAPALEAPSSRHLKKPKREEDSDEGKQYIVILDTGKVARDPSPEVGEVSNTLQIQERELKTSNWDRESVGSFLEVEVDVNDESEQPTESFKVYLDHEQPLKIKVVKTSVMALGDKGLTNSHSKSTSKLPKVKKNKLEKLQPVEASATMLGKVPADASPLLPDLPLPVVEDSYTQLPTLELMSSFQTKSNELSSPQEDEEHGFVGCRINSKMQVYSGPKSAYLSQTMTLHEQVIQALKNNTTLDMGEIPYSVLEPILKGCTPDKLYNIEKYNHEVVGKTDELWKSHCHRDFKDEKPEENESWRELYLRLQDAREQRLRVLTMSIQSAQASRSKDRQTKMIFFNSVAKSPCEALRRQEEFGTEAASLQKAKNKSAPHPTGSSHAPSSSSSSRLNPTPEKPAFDCPNPSSAHPAQVTRKPAAKKVAPLMAKTIRDFKNSISRR